MSSLVYYTPVHEIPSIVQNLRDQFDSGLTKDFEFRKKQLQNILRFFDENATAIDKALYDDLHKHRIEGRISEVAPVVDECKYLIKNLEKLAEPKNTSIRFKMHANAKVYVRKEPKGVVLVIGAWNYPVHLLLLPVVGAIAAGNCVVLKPSEVAEHTADFISRVLPQYLDKRAYVIVNGGAEETTKLLEEKFDHIFYTGNGTVGRIVMSAAAKTLTPVTLELGGKSPAVVTSTADIDIAAHRLIWGKLFNTGQTCVAPDYVLVVKEKADELLSAIRRALREFYGNNAKDSDSYGRIINARHFDRLKRILDNIEKDKIVVGGESDRESLFIAPTVVSPVAPDDPNLMRAEIFGPILPIVPVQDLEEAVKVIKAHDHPLAMYIFSTSSAEYNYVLDKTNSGGTLVNDTLVHLLELSLPFGGVGGSGMGSYHGEKSFETFTHERATMVKTNALESLMKTRYPPYNDDKETLMSLLVFGLPSTATAKVKTIVGLFGSAWRVITTSGASNNQSKL